MEKTKKDLEKTNNNKKTRKNNISRLFGKGPLEKIKKNIEKKKDILRLFGEGPLEKIKKASRKQKNKQYFKTLGEGLLENTKKTSRKPKKQKKTIFQDSLGMAPIHKTSEIFFFVCFLFSRIFHGFPFQILHLKCVL